MDQSQSRASSRGESTPSPTHVLRRMQSALLPGERQMSAFQQPTSTPDAFTTVTDPVTTRASVSPGSSEFPPPRVSSQLVRHESPAPIVHGADLASSTRPMPVLLPGDRPVNPALLSDVARALENAVVPTNRTKNELTYARAFDGQETVDKLMEIARTRHRDLALLLGRALDAQKFFHDVTYDHRLRDSQSELYQFYYDRWGPHIDGEAFALTTPAASRRNSSSTAAGRPTLTALDMERVYSAQNALAIDDADEKEAQTYHPEYPIGVFTPLTSCYSPTCQPGQPCYSYACPNNRVELTSVQSTLQREDSHEGLNEITTQLWAESVPKEIYNQVPDMERKRQEVIFEIISTERAYVQDLEYLRDIWIKPLSTQHILSESRRDGFVEKVFCNLLEILAVNARLSEMLMRRQRHHAVIDHIGDIFVEFVREFDPYVKYGANQAAARLAVEAEKSSNPIFAMFAADTERKAVSRKLELNGYLTKPTTRLARYPLLFEQMLKFTAESNVDKMILPKVIQQIQRLLTHVNDETGRSENRLQLTFLSRHLVFKPLDMVDLRLNEEGRELVFKNALKKRGTQSDSSEIQLYLFDHALLMVKVKIVHKAEVFRVYRRPIPLEFLQVTVYDDVQTSKGIKTRSVLSRSSIGKRTSIGAMPGQTLPKQDSKSGYAITFAHLGKRGYHITLWSTTMANRSKWLEHVEMRQEILQNRSRIFDMIPVAPGMMDVPTNRITCAVPFDFCRQIFFGREDGVYLANVRDDTHPPKLVLALPGVTQVDVLEEFQILIVLAEQVVHTFTLNALDPADPVMSLKRGRRIASHTSFFRAGVCMGRTLVCVVKSGPVSSTIKTLEPIEYSLRAKKQQTFRKLLQGGQDTLRVFKEFYIPTESSSIHFLKSKLCIGTTKGFEIVDLETLETQGLLDPADQSLDFVQRRENLKAIAIYRIEGEFLLCYNEFAFYVNKNGWRAKGNWIIHWEGNPTSFALHYPYILAFESNFIEVRHVETGALHQVITGFNLRCLFADTFSASIQSRSYNHRLQKMGYANPMRTNSMPVQQVTVAPPNIVGSPAAASMTAAMGGIQTPVVPPGTMSDGSSPYNSPRLSFSYGSPLSLQSQSFGPLVQSPPNMTSGTAQSSVLESVLASRSEILFVGDSSAYAIRPHT
ncbi:cnh-domain-containing protein [Malassezia pachydermatis]|uniref:Cnh-domain-containing protein n=1 Tax=Malassezia pachydermatis TaxID=77020 RepID=A0A0M8MJF6_9BASI|nr:cnh-domain-containing protein [Malassezia pachydermatis]KOS12758.1 cnh-domain-containing protein [Malassezia pachydermatis]